MQLDNNDINLLESNNSFYSNRLVCFIDVLGFSQKIISSDGKKIKSILDDLYELVNELKNKTFKDIKITTFSDCVVISVESNTQFVFELIISISRIQMIYLTRGFLTRVGISSGAFFHDDRMLFGKPLINAVTLEKNVDKPIILLDEAFHEDMKHTFPGFDKSMIRGLFRLMEPFNDTKFSGYRFNFVKIAYDTMVDRSLIKIKENNTNILDYIKELRLFWSGILFTLNKEKNDAPQKAKNKIQYLIKSVMSFDFELLYDKINKSLNLKKYTDSSFPLLQPIFVEDLNELFLSLYTYTEKETLSFVKKHFKKQGDKYIYELPKEWKE